MHPIDLLEARSLPLAALVGLALFAACGEPAREEVFKETQGALAEKLGDPCATFPVTEAEVVVEDQSLCEPGYCVTVGSEPGASEGEGVCSCRCDGPKGTGPFCACGDGFTCQHLIEDLGGLEDRELAGSYCIPE